MDFGITADSWWQTKVSETLHLVPQREFKDFFLDKNYGNDLTDLFIVLVCHQPDKNLKQRIRFIKKEKILYMDIMLDFDLFLKIDQQQRNTIIFKKLVSEVPEIIAKYKFKDFDLNRFTKDWLYLINNLNISS